MTPRPLQPGGTLWSVLVLCTVVAVGISAVKLSPEGLRVVAWWPIAGLSVALLARNTLKSWAYLVPALGVSYLSILLASDRPVVFSLAYATASVSSVVLGAMVLRGRRRPHEVVLRTQRDLLRLALSAGATATVMVLGGVLYALSQGDRPPDSLQTLAISNLASLLVIVPALTSGRGTLRRFRPSSLVLQSGLLVLALAIVFSPDQSLALSFLPLPLLTWAAYRFGLGIVSWQVVFCAAAVNVLTAQGYGPFALSAGAGADTVVVGSLTQAYLACMALICLPVAIGVHNSDVLHRKLRSSRDLSDMMLATTGCMILVSDIRGTVLEANPAVAATLGHRREDVIGRPIWDTIVSPQHRDVARAMFTSADGSGVPPNVDGRVPDVNGNERRVMWSAGLVRDEYGEVTRIVMTGLDVTAERNASGLMEHLLGAALDTAIIGMDPQGNITLFNTGAQKMLGLSTFDAVGSQFVDALDPAGFEAWAQRRGTTTQFSALLTHLLDAPPQDWEWRTKPEPHAPVRRVSMTLSAIRDHSDSLIGYLCVGTDVTQIHATAELLVNALEKERQVVGHLKSLDSAKDQFVSTVSHELRTPVSTIIGYGEMLSDGALGSLTQAQVKALDAITRNGERLVDLVDNLLALSGLATESPTWDRDPVDLRGVVSEARVATERLVGDRSLSITFDCPDSPVRVFGDNATLLLALNNLISNAVKFTPDGGQVRCHLDVFDEQARVIVHDTGLGIPTDELPRVFERFWRSSTSQSREIQGTGLGMPTVLSVVSAHGGTVVVDSAHMSGTTVTVQLPLAEPSAPGERAPGA